MIISSTVGEAHEKIISYILRYGEHVVTEDNEMTMELMQPLVVRVRNPLMFPRVSGCNRFGEHALQEYSKQFMSITPKRDDGKDFSYTYGNRIWDYPYVNSGGLNGDGDKRGIDQVGRVIDMLNDNPTTRRAVVHVWFDPIDGKSEYPPCLQMIQFVTRNEKLNTTAVFRSNDMLSAWGANAYALTELLKVVAEQCDVGVGFLETVSISAHMYVVRDKQELDTFRRKLNV